MSSSPIGNVVSEYKYQVRKEKKEPFAVLWGIQSSGDVSQLRASDESSSSSCAKF